MAVIKTCPLGLLLIHEREICYQKVVYEVFRLFAAVPDVDMLILRDAPGTKRDKGRQGAQEPGNGHPQDMETKADKGRQGETYSSPSRQSAPQVWMPSCSSSCLIYDDFTRKAQLHDPPQVFAH